jgi:hypothetical protein
MPAPAPLDALLFWPNRFCQSVPRLLSRVLKVTLVVIKENIEDLGKSVRILGQKLEETRKAAAAAKARASLSTGAEEDPDSQTLAQIRALQETMDHIVTHLATQDPAGLASPRPESASPKAVAASPTSDTTPSKADED